ncbi:MAG: TIGR04086 family membrane protein [Christensenellales bacterium]|jgi:putative membrane protein (TIGR04086 family)
MAKGRRPAGKHRRQGGAPGWIIAKSVLVSAILTMLLMLLLAFVLKSGIIGEDAVPIANQVLKVLGIALASYLAVRSGATHPWFRGMISGLAYMITGILVFSIFVGFAGFSPSMLLDAGMGIVVGALVGVMFGKKTQTQ